MPAGTASLPSTSPRARELARPKNLWAFFKQVYFKWRQDNAQRMGAALAYYMTFSIAPLLILAMAIVGFFFGRRAAQGELVDQLQDLMGRQGAQAVQHLIASAYKPTSGTI